MGVKFVAASSQFLQDTATPLTAYPFTVACWARPPAISVQRAIWTLNIRSASAGSYFVLFQDGTTNAWTLESADGSATDDLTSGTSVANRWFFFVTRCISATSRRLDVLSETGTYTTATSAPSITHVNLASRMNVGCFDNGTSGNSLFWDGEVAEFWYTNTDIYPRGALPRDLALQLAYYGPFHSGMNIGSHITEYRSFRNSPLSGGGADIYFGTRRERIWTNNAGVVSGGRHPPLYPDYVTPRDTKRLILV